MQCDRCNSHRQIQQRIIAVACGLVFIFQSVCAAPAQSTDDPADRRLERIQRWLKSKDASVRLSAVKELAGVRQADALPLLLAALKDPNVEVRCEAAHALEHIPDPKAVIALRDLLKDTNEQVRGTAVFSISHIGGIEVLPAVINLAQHDESDIVRFRAVWGLAYIRDKSALPVVIEALSDYVPSVRERAALLALEALHDDTVPTRLLEIAKHPYAPTRRIVMYLLARYPNDGAIPALTEALKDRDPLVRGEAAMSLGKLKARSALAALLPLLKDPDEHVRGATAYALGLIGDSSVMDELRPLLKEKPAFIRAITAESMHTLGDTTVKPLAGFKSADLFTYPIHSPEHTGLYK